MKIYSTFLFLACGLLMTMNANAQNWNNWGPGVKGEGPIVKKTLSLDAISGVELAVSGNVYIRQGSTQKIEVESHQNILDLLSTEVVNDSWKIRFDKSVRGYDKFNVYITVPTLKRMAVSGSGNIKGETPFTGNTNMSLAVSGSGNITAELQCADVDAAISGSGNIHAKGKARSIRSAISGSGNVYAGSLEVATASITISGSGNCTVNVQEKFDAQISGSGDAYYYGRPRVNAKVSGSGKVRAKD